MTRVNDTKEAEISEIILSMERPFKISQLFQEMERHDITDMTLVLEVLDQLCDSGLIKYSEVENDEWAYKKNLQYS